MLITSLRMYYLEDNFLDLDAYVGIMFTPYMNDLSRLNLGGEHGIGLNLTVLLFQGS